MIALCFFLFLCAVSPITMTVRPLMAFAPSDVHIVIRIVPDDRHRALIVMASSAEYDRSSGWTLDGAQAARTYDVEWRQVPAGEYEVIAAIVDTNAKILARVRQTMRLIAADGAG